jgi:imidazolonepropionase
MASSTLFRNIGNLLTLSGVAQKKGRHVTEADMAPISQAAMVVRDGKIEWIGKERSLPKSFRSLSKEVDLKKQTVLPGFVECHTHAVFAGSRAHEFELRNQGVSYQEISAQGGGIKSTVKATREMKPQALLELTQKRVNRFVTQGVTTLEIKSGYGLDLETELKCLKLIQKLKPIHFVATYLGAHAIPAEFSSAEDYLHFCQSQVLPLIAKKKLASRVDIFIEKGFFAAEVAQKYLHAARELGFSVCVHADQLTLSGGADSALAVGADSADHLIQITDKEISRLSQSQTTCVLLPAADLYMKCAYPPARKLIDAGARVALATDFNPGTSPTQDLSLVGLLARLEMKMSLPEVIAAYTYNAACALKQAHLTGTLELEKNADFISIDGDWQDLFYSIGDLKPSQVYVSGHSVRA